MEENYESMHVDFFHNTNIPKKVTYTLNGNYHNLKGPALILYYESGNVRCFTYYKNGRLHRKGKNPAIVRYYESGVIQEIRYFKFGNMRSVQGKHQILYDINGNELN